MRKTSDFLWSALWPLIGLAAYLFFRDRVLVPRDLAWQTVMPTTGFYMIYILAKMFRTENQQLAVGNEWAPLLGMSVVVVGIHVLLQDKTLYVMPVCGLILAMGCAWAIAAAVGADGGQQWPMFTVSTAFQLICIAVATMLSQERPSIALGFIVFAVLMPLACAGLQFGLTKQANRRPNAV